MNVGRWFRVVGGRSTPACRIEVLIAFLIAGPCFVSAAWFVDGVAHVAQVQASEPVNPPVPAAPEAGSSDSRSSGDSRWADRWTEVDTLRSHQKYRAAADEVAEIREAARDAGAEEDWTRALIDETNLRSLVDGPETALRFLRDQPWPDDTISHAVLELYYADALVKYARRYGREIRERVQVDDSSETDLRVWTLDQILTETHRAFARVWSTRAEWGALPITALPRYLEPNTYPPRIRGTLRDAVAYLWVELLVTQSYWRPEHSNEIYRLDLPALIAGNPTGAQAIDLTAGAIHPMIKVCAILDDLEAWHRGSGTPQDSPRAEAALEARLERLRRLHRVYSRQPEDRQQIVQSLESSLGDADQSLPWWSFAQAELAQFLRERKDPDALIRAREVASVGALRHPESVGGERCRRIVQEIEAPNFEVHAMASDAPGRPSIRVEHRNLPRLYFRAWRHDVVRSIRVSTGISVLPRRGRIEDLVANQTPDAVWALELPETKDYRRHVTYGTPPLEPGAYIVVASARSDFADQSNRLIAMHMILGDLVLVVRQLPGEWEVTARSGATGQPLADVDVELFHVGRGETRNSLGQSRTGADGRARIENEDGPRGQYFVTAQHGSQVALFEQRAGGRSGGYKRETRAFVYTDRSVYRPGQTIHWKVVAYVNEKEAGRYHTVPGALCRLALHGPNLQVADTLTAVTNEFGSASGEFVVPDQGLLGQWRISTSLGAFAAIRVEEYKRPTFEVEIDEPTGSLRLNQPAILSGSARYYFGLPASSGSVRWSVAREAVYAPWHRHPQHRRSQTVASGDARLAADGSFEIEFTPEAPERDSRTEGLSYRYRLSVDVTDTGGETESASRRFRIGYEAIDARIDSDRQFFLEGDPAELTVLRSDRNGTPRAGVGTWTLVKLAQPETAVLPADRPIKPTPWEDDRYWTPGDRKRPRWDATIEPGKVMASWKGGATIASGEVEHGDDGVATVDLPRLEAGPYRLLYETKDEFGATCRVPKEILVAGKERTPVALPILVLANRASVSVGETAHLLVRSALPDQPMVLEVYRGGERLERRVLRAGQDSERIEFPIRERDRGGFAVVVTALRDHQLLTATQRIFVPWDDRKLDVAFSTFRDRLRPGTKETFRVSVRAMDGRRLDSRAAELLAYMYDRSLDAIAAHRAPNPLSLYPNRTGHVEPRSSVGHLRPKHWWGRGFPPRHGVPQPLRGDQLKAVGGRGIGGPGSRNLSGLVSLDLPFAMADGLHIRGGRSYEVGSLGEVQVVAPSVARLTSGDATSSDLASGVADSEAELREDFSETAVFLPHLRLDKEGEATIEFQVPDAVTDWNVWVHALTNDLRSGSANRQASSVKELMVRPYVPRFLREGDQASIEVVINNAGDQPLSGTLEMSILDPDTEEDLGAAFGLEASPAGARPFAVEAGAGASLRFTINVPARVGPVAFKAVAKAGAFSDGEIRPVPVLPGRLHLMESRFAALKDSSRRELRFDSLAADDDSSRIDDQLVVTVDAQLFYGVLQALPYLVEFPHECSEQLLNRFVCTGIVSGLYDEYPAVGRMARELSTRESRLEAWSGPDPNRTMMLEETPWAVRAAGGNADPPQALINVLDPDIARTTRDGALAKLQAIQTSSGGFSWWQGGFASKYMTLYVLQGLSRALEFGVEIPKDPVRRAWSYLATRLAGGFIEGMEDGDYSRTLTFVNYTLSCYPDETWTGKVWAELRDRMLDHSFTHWRTHPPLLKGYLALTLARAGRDDDARLVFDSVMDSAVTDDELGTYWAPEDRAWLWYNDTIETHAFALRVLTELQPDDPRRHGLVQWLFLNKHLNHWKSTRATSEVIYALVHYLEQEDAVASREAVSVVLGSRERDLVFEPDSYTGANNHLVIAGPEIDPATMSTVEVEKSTPGFAFASATWHYSTERLPEAAEGDLLEVTRRYFHRTESGDEWVLRPVNDGEVVEVGDQLEVHLSIRAKHAAEYVHLRDPRGAGFEPESVTSRHRSNLGLRYYEEIRDSGANFYFEQLPRGEYTLKYRVRAATAGTFRVGPATLQPLYAPEFAAYSAGNRLEVNTMSK